MSNGSWIAGIQDEIARAQEEFVKSRAHLVLEVPKHWAIETHIERVMKTGGERLHIIVSNPNVQVEPR